MAIRFAVSIAIPPDRAITVFVAS